jgi:transcriptional regulator with XRE-family HTH domain
MWGIGKRRSKVGKFIDQHGYTQEDLCKAAGIGRNTASRVCSDPEYTPSTKVIQRILKALRKLDSDVRVDDFFDM